MSRVSAKFFDGKSSHSVDVDVSLFDSGLISITGPGVALTTRYGEVKFSQRIGDIPRSLYLDDGAKVELQDNDVVDDYLDRIGKERHWTRLHWFEKTKITVIGALVTTVLVLYIAVEYGIPKLANYVAQSLPYSVEEQISEHALLLIDQGVFGPTKIDEDRQNGLRTKFASMTRRSAPELNFRFEFRDGKSVGPNAFALPSGIIVFTDQLVYLAQHDNELLAVLAHEIGHVVHRHSLRNLLQSSTTAMLIATVTGDLTSIAGLAATLPAILMETKYSRKFETESDDYAFSILRKQGIELRYFAQILERMTPEGEGDDQVTNYLSTHPATGARIKRIQN